MHVLAGLWGALGMVSTAPKPLLRRRNSPQYLDIGLAARDCRPCAIAACIRPKLTGRADPPGSARRVPGRCPLANRRDPAAAEIDLEVVEGRGIVDALKAAVVGLGKAARRIKKELQ